MRPERPVVPRPAGAHAEKIRLKGDSKGPAVASTYDIVVNDVVTNTKTSTKQQAKQQQAYVKRYDGEVNLEADDTIVFKADKTLDTTKSTIKFDTLSFADGGVATFC